MRPEGGSGGVGTVDVATGGAGTTAVGALAQAGAVPWLYWALWLFVGFAAVYPGVVAYMVWAERKIAARFQDRIGPNRVGPFGLLQPIADFLKLITKEDIVPEPADR